MSRMKLDSVEVGAEYIHFKGGHYVVECIAKHTETGERMVVYSGVSDGRIWVRPYDMFTDGRFQKVRGEQK